jgi:hypothetical protein
LVVFAYLTRLIWLECLLKVAWWASFALHPRRRLAFAVRIVEWRATLLGHSRPASSPPREWLLHQIADQVTGQGDSETQVSAIVRSFCDLADRLCFGESDGGAIGQREHQITSGFVGALPMKTLKTIFGKKTACRSR